MSLTSKAFRTSFLCIKKNIASASIIRSTLAAETGKKSDFSHLKEDSHDSHGHGHESHPPAINYSPKSVFSKQSVVSTSLSSCRHTKIQTIPRRWYTTQAAPEKKKVAVVLSGSGVHDGTEIQEAVSVLVHLSRAGVEAKCFAPDKNQVDVINHIKGTASDETRNVLVESARIARGKVKALSQLKADDFAGIIFPGGYGAAKNLCTFAKDGESCTVDSDVERVIKEFHQAKKPIGLLCVSPVIAAKLFPGVQVTLGNDDKDINDAITRMGAKPQPAGVTDVVVDEANNIVSSPAYMCNTSVHKVYDGVGKLVETVLNLTKKPDSGAASQTAAAPAKN